MKLTITDSSTQAPILLEVKPESHLNEVGYRVIYPNGTNFFISNKLGTWRVADDHHVDPDLLIQIGLAIENNKFEKY
ncbi:MAG: hypothetical protein ACO1N7_06280 [Sphingobacteriaceae bacterium]